MNTSYKKNNSRKKQYETLIRSVKNRILKENLIKNEISIFLCGAGEKDKEKESSRFLIGEMISKTKGTKYFYSVYYPERFFLNLMFDYNKENILQLENFLAKSVSCVTILLDSAGAIAELGAFSNHPELCKKLIVVVDVGYQNDRSFINLGPIKHLKSINKHSVIYHDYKNQTAEDLVKIVMSTARTIHRERPINVSLENPFHAIKYIFTLVYLLGPITKEKLDKLIYFEEPEASHHKIKIAYETAILELFNQACFHHTSKGLLTDQGSFEKIFQSVDLFKKYSIRHWISKSRLQAINLTLRKNGVGR